MAEHGQALQLILAELEQINRANGGIHSRGNDRLSGAGESAMPIGIQNYLRP
jgi:hypothetical protein